MLRKQVFFVRHGESDTNVDAVYRGDHALLTLRGGEQAFRVADRMRHIGVEALISSTLPRALHTAETIAMRTDLPLETSPLFVERQRPSAMRGKSYGDPSVVRMSREIFGGYLATSHRHSDEENLDDLRTRALASLAFLEQHPAERLCVVTHGYFLKVLFVVILTGGELPGSELHQATKGLCTVENASITHARFESPAPFGEGIGAHYHPWAIVTWNDSAHLE